MTGRVNGTASYENLYLYAIAIEAAMVSSGIHHDWDMPNGES